MGEMSKGQYKRDGFYLALAGCFFALVALYSLFMGEWKAFFGASGFAVIIFLISRWFLKKARQ